MRHSPRMPSLRGDGCTHHVTVDLPHEGSVWSSMLPFGGRRPYHSHRKKDDRPLCQSPKCHPPVPPSHGIGAKVAPSNSYNFASSQKATKWLDQTWWEHIKANIEVVKDFKYLGAHLTSISATTSPTINKRWDKAMQQFRKKEPWSRSKP